MDGHTLFTELKKILADLYVMPADAQRIAADAGLDLAQVPFDAKAINNWHNILAVAIRSGVLTAVLDTALGEYARHQPLLSICESYRYFIASGGQLDAPNLLYGKGNTNSVIETVDSSYVAGNVTVGHDFIGHDRNIYGDYVIGDKYEIKTTPVEWPISVNVPPKPNLLVGREELMKKLVACLISGENPALSIEGLPGVGKTTLLVSLAHNQEVLAHFKDGVLWSSLGKQPDVMRTLAIWARALNYDVSDLKNAAERTQAVKNIIGQRHLLLMIDDAWDLDAAKFLRCGGPNCCHILTTRDQAIARAFSGSAQVKTIPILDDEIAYKLLKKLAPEACNTDPNTAQKLVKMVGGLPITIELLGGYLADPEHCYFPELSQEALVEMVDPQRRLKLASQRLGTLDDNYTLPITLEEIVMLSLCDLPEEAVKAFYALGAFAANPSIFHRSAAEYVSQVNIKTLTVLIARNLVQQHKSEYLSLHQLLADVARTRLPFYAMKRHLDYYLNAVRSKVADDWQSLESIYEQVQWAIVQNNKKRLYMCMSLRNSSNVNIEDFKNVCYTTTLNLRNILIADFKSKKIDISDDISVSIKMRIDAKRLVETFKDKLSQKQKKQLIAEDDFIITVARDPITFEQKYAEREVAQAIYPVSKNTAFCSLMRGDKLFACDNLTSLSPNYQNENPAWNKYYNSTLVVPIKVVDSEHVLRPVGFLVVDSLNKDGKNLYEQNNDCFQIMNKFANFLAHYLQYLT